MIKRYSLLAALFCMTLNAAAFGQNFDEGNKYLENKKYDSAIEEFTKVIKLDPQSYPAYLNRGNAYREKGDLDNALNDYAQAIRINPAEGLIYYNRALVYQMKKDIKSAISDYSEAVKLKPDFAEAYNNRGNLYGVLGNLDLAIADFTSILNESYNNLYVNEKSQMILLKKDSFVPLDPEEKEKINGFRVTAYFNRGNTYIQKKDIDRAISDYEKVLKLDPQFSKAPIRPFLAQCYNNKAYGYYLSGNDLDKAMVLIDKAIEFAPGDGIILGTKAEILYKMGNYKEAYEYIKKALTLEPNHAGMLKDRENIEKALGKGK